MEESDLSSSSSWENVIKDMMASLEQKLSDDSTTTETKIDEQEQQQHNSDTSSSSSILIDNADEFILPEPSLSHQVEFNQSHLPITPVVVDPNLAKHLRSHQKDGVKFLYKAVYLDSKSYRSGGCILSDDMGLGKTLQCITLVWTLYKQGPYAGKSVIKQILIVTPSSLVDLWKKEFIHWLGNDKIRVHAVTSVNTLEKWNETLSPVLIISYEMAMRNALILKTKHFDLMICDEAHKIKNSKLHIYQLLKSLHCSRRILVTGTPVSNDLMELFNLIDFVRPGLLGNEKEFRKKFQNPISKYQKEANSRTLRGLGMELAGLLNAKIAPVFLRRDACIMLNYLPRRITQIVFCKASPLQAKLYKAVKNCKMIVNCLNGSNHQSQFAAFSLLKKLCNHPNLVHPGNQQGNSIDEIYEELGNQFPKDMDFNRIIEADSGKLGVLVRMLKQFRNEGNKVVLVSHYTKTLDLLETVCKKNELRILRLEGSTLQKDRTFYIERFNSSREPLVFLLSSKAGGVGLNLQSASNIILYDIDWNPAYDVQAMARCWRPGQKKETNIYRLLTCGTIEERIYQRQISKQDVSGSVIDLLLSNTTKFSSADLKDIFTYYEVDGCLTHVLLGCHCNGDGSNIVDSQHGNVENQPPPIKKRKLEGMGELLKWEHFKQPLNPANVDSALLHPSVECIFRSKFSGVTE